MNRMERFTFHQRGVQLEGFWHYWMSYWKVRFFNLFRQRRMKMRNRMGQGMVELIATGAALFLGFILVLSSWVNIPQGTVGVVFDKSKGGVLPQTMGQGWHLRKPLVQWIQEYPVALRTYNALGIGEGADKESNAINLPTLKGQHIQQDISVVYNVQPDKASYVFDKFKGADIEDIEVTFIRRMVVSVANNI